MFGKKEAKNFKYEVHYSIIGVTERDTKITVTLEKSLESKQISSSAWLQPTLSSTYEKPFWSNRKKMQNVLVSKIFDSYLYMHPEEFKRRLVIKSILEVR